MVLFVVLTVLQTWPKFSNCDRKQWIDSGMLQTVQYDAMCAVSFMDLWQIGKSVDICGAERQNTKWMKTFLQTEADSQCAALNLCWQVSAAMMDEDEGFLLLRASARDSSYDNVICGRLHLLFQMLLVEIH